MGRFGIFFNSIYLMAVDLKLFVEIILKKKNVFKKI